MEISTHKSQAFERLTTQAAVLATELRKLPKAQDYAVGEPQALLQQIERFWVQPGSYGTSRKVQFINALERSVHDLVTLNIEAGELRTGYANCLPHSPNDTAVTCHALKLSLADTYQIDIAGALVFTNPQGLALLFLPGYGVEGFVTIDAMLAALTAQINDPAMRFLPMQNTCLSDQATVYAEDEDPDIVLEPFVQTDWQLISIPSAPFDHAFEQQVTKQRADIEFVCSRIVESNPALSHVHALNEAIRMPGLLGCEAIIQALQSQGVMRQQYAALPAWFKLANVQERQQYIQRLQEYDQVREVCLSTMGPASSPEHYANEQLRGRMADDLGVDLDPDQLLVTTRRSLPMTGEHYQVARSLTQLALWGLHPNDTHEGSEFLMHSQITLGAETLDESMSGLTPAYIANAIESLDLRASFGAAQLNAYGSAQTQQLMRAVMHQQLVAQAYAAKLQGHIQTQDFEMIERLDPSINAQANPDVVFQQLKLNARDVLSDIWVIRKVDAQGALQRLVMFTPDSPRGQELQGFDNERQLLHEIVGWSASPEMSQYLVERVVFAQRQALQEQLGALRDKPTPTEDFIGYIRWDHYADALQAQVKTYARVKLTEQTAHTPTWYLRASVEQRQKLTALEDAITAAHQLYSEKPHTRVPEFEVYVHQRASDKINALLGLPDGSVDPDDIIITSPREQLTYTQMLRNGYDDTFGPISASADTTATFTGPAGIDLKALTAEKVARSVHGKWLADDYVNLVRLSLLDPASDGYEYRRRHSLLLTQLHMSAAALRSLLKTEITDSQYGWLTASINSLDLSDAKTRLRHPVYPLQFKIENPLIASGAPELDKALNTLMDVNRPLSTVRTPKIFHIETVQGCFVLSEDDANDPAQTLIYTPQAPDGIEFRRLDSFSNTLLREGMSDYYKDRCRLKANRTLAFFLADLKKGGASQAPVVPSKAYLDLQHTCFDQTVLRKIRDVEETTTGRHDMLAQMIWMSIEIIALSVTLPFPIASFAVGAAFVLRYDYLAFEALREGDREAASAHILASLLNAVGAAGDLYSGLKGFGAVVKRMAQQAERNRALHTVKPLRRAATRMHLNRLESQDELFWIGRPELKSHTPLRRSNALLPDRLQPTELPTQQSSDAIWHALQADSIEPIPVNRTVANPSYAVNVSLADGTVITQGHGQGVTLLQGKHYVGLDGRVFQVRYDAQFKRWNIIDPNNPFAFFGKQPVRLSAQGAWEILDPLGLQGGVPGKFKPLIETPAESSTAVGGTNDYEMPSHLRNFLKDIVKPAAPFEPHSVHRASDALFEYHENILNLIYRENRPTYTGLRQNLYRDAEAFFVAPTLASKPDLPVLTEAAEFKDLMELAFEGAKGLVISETPSSMAAKQLLINNMKVLKDQEVKVLYIEHVFTDQHLHKLQKYKGKGQEALRGRGSHEIKNHLKELNDGALSNGSDEFDYYHVIKAAHQNGIEVKPFNSSVSYDFPGNPVTTAVDDHLAPRKMSTFFGNKVISADVAAHPNQRWVALLDQRVANTLQGQPGIAELQGVVSVRIEAAASGSTGKISRDVGVEPGIIRADFKLAMANTDIPGTSASAGNIANAPDQATDLDRSLHALLDANLPSNRTWDPTRKVFVPLRKPPVNPYVGEYGLKLDSAGAWKRTKPGEWPGASSPSALQLSLTDELYQLPVEQHATFHGLANFDNKGLHPHYFYADPLKSEVRKAFFNLRQQLQNDARTILNQPLPPRAELPVVAADITPPAFLDRLYESARGVVVGEAHSATASKQFIIDNMEHLAKREVKTLYLEHLLTDLHQADLDRFAQTGLMSKRLLHDLKRLDKGHRVDLKRGYTFEKLVTQAKKHGIEVRAIDCAASYYIKNMATASETSRQQMMSYFASRTIRKHQEIMGEHKWIALVGNSHANTYKNVPGIAELEHGIGVRVADVEPGQSRSTLVDPGEQMKQLGQMNGVFVKNDFLVGAHTPARLPQQLSIADRLREPGQFMIDDADPANLVIKHRSRDQTLQETPIKRTASDQLYVERESWETVHGKVFHDLKSLITALEEMNLTFIKGR
ncbi:MAG TPA: membrane-targeted effector domain-containing toxin [Pseudomonas sp.]|uniref:membrane-targeted effector domain-containing toxin n=1 Tax=Pseudomonas sp. TaxID=306 RepID=UPI002EDB0787